MRCRTIFCCWTICGRRSASPAQKRDATAASAAPARCWSTTQPRLSCLTLAASVAGRRVDTVESLGDDGRLSAVQRGFHEKLGSQCGYCTPGFIMASVGLLRRNPQPERRRDQGGARLQHLPLHRLCEDHRGGEIRRRAWAAGRRAMNEIVPAHNIGDYVPMVDGPEKVSGRAKYTADLAIEPGTLAGRIYRSPYAHAEIIEVDVSEALKLPGVKAIVTGAECDKTFGVLPIARSRASARARQGALSRRAGRRRRRGRRRHRQGGARADQDDGEGAAGLFHLSRGDGARRGAAARQEARQSRARRVLRARQCRAGLRRRRSRARGRPTTAPRSARTRWRCTPRSRATTPCATA